MKKIAIIKSGFIDCYLIYMQKLCSLNGILLDVFNNDNKNYTKLFNDYDYIITDNNFLPFCINIFHSHTIIEKVKNYSLLPYKIIFFLGHLKQIMYSKRYFPTMPKTIVVSDRLKQDMVQNYNIPESSIIVAYAGFDKNKNNDLKKIQKYNYNNPFIVGMDARGFVNKGGYIFLKAIKVLIKNYPKIKIKAYIIYPSYKTNLFVKFFIRILGLNSYVTFFKWQNDMNIFYDKINCLVCASHLEGFGRVVTEAMYAKVPVIIGSNVGAACIIKDGINGFVFDYYQKRIYNLAQKIKEVYDKYNDLNELVENAYKISKSFTWENFAKTIIESLYNK